MSLSLLARDYEKEKTQQFLAALATLFVTVLDVVKLLQCVAVKI